MSGLRKQGRNCEVVLSIEVVVRGCSTVLVYSLPATRTQSPDLKTHRHKYRRSYKLLASPRTYKKLVKQTITA